MPNCFPMRTIAGLLAALTVAAAHSPHVSPADSPPGPPLHTSTTVQPTEPTATTTTPAATTPKPIRIHRPPPASASEAIWLYTAGGVIIVAVLLVLVAVLATVVRREPPKKTAGELLAATSRQQPDPNFIYPRTAFSAKAKATEHLMNALADADQCINPLILRQTVHDLFLRVQRCWPNRDFAPVREQLTSALYLEFSAAVDAHRRDHEVNMREDFRIESVDFIRLRYADQKVECDTTALVTALARNYFADETTRRLVRGNLNLVEFQEFWTFYRTGDNWRLGLVERAVDSQMLQDANQVQTSRGVDPSASSSEVGDWKPYREGGLPAAVEISRLLHHRAGEQPHWAWDAIKETVRRAFLGLAETWQRGDGELLAALPLSGDLLRRYRRELRSMKDAGLSFSFHDLRIRKIDLLEVNLAPERFSAMIAVEARKNQRERGRPERVDAEPAPYSETWRFSLIDGRWSLIDRGAADMGPMLM